MRIALDAMGGDYAPKEIVLGAIEAIETIPGITVSLVGKTDEIIKYLPENFGSNRIEIVEATEIIEMDDHPSMAYRRKKDASVTVATRLVKDGKADAIVSAGSTGGQMVSSLFVLGRIKGVERPAIGTIFPTLQGGKLLLDAGANADAKPSNLLQFALMGNTYAKDVLKISNPKVALVNIGEEATKGNELAINTYEVLSNEKGINFIGNIEGRNIPLGVADVMVCDGFVGNIILKTAEGMASTIMALIKEEVEKSIRGKIGAAVMLPVFKGVKQKMDYAEYGGAPLLGVNGVSIICHGSSKAKAIKNAIKVAVDCVNNKFVIHLKEKFGEEDGE